MNKTKLIFIIFFLLASVLSLIIEGTKAVNSKHQAETEKAYLSGWSEGVKSITLENLCFELEVIGVGGTYKGGDYKSYDVYKCHVLTGKTLEEDLSRLEGGIEI